MVHAVALLAHVLPRYCVGRARTPHYAGIGDWHRNCSSSVDVQPSGPGSAMGHSTTTQITCAICHCVITGRAVAISEQEYCCFDCWQSFLRKLFKDVASRDEVAQSAEV